MKKTQPKPLQLLLDPRRKMAAKIRAAQKDTTISAHVGDLIQSDADLFGAWALINREDACDG